MLTTAAAVALAVADVCIKHDQLGNSSTPVRTFTANFSDFDGLTLDPKVRYRTENNDLHVVAMAAVGECDPNCTYSARVTFEETPQQIRYTISSGDGFGHAMWVPPEGVYGVFWVLPRGGPWIEVGPIPNGTKQSVIVNVSVAAAAADDVRFVFADTGEEVPFDGAGCIDSPCSKQVTVDVGTRSRVDYYVDTADGAHFWPDERPFDTFYVQRPAEERGAAPLSDGAWAGIGIGIALGTALVVYGVYRAVTYAKEDTGAEGEKLISGTAL